MLSNTDESGYSELDTASESDFTANPATTSASNKKARSRPRSGSNKKIKYWTLPTMSSGTFNPSMLTARQQLAYLAQKSRLGEESDSLELSPLRLDRIKFEEMKSLTLKEQEFQSSSSPKNSNNNNNNTPFVPSSPSSRASSAMKSSASSKVQSKLKDEIILTPPGKKFKQVKLSLAKSIIPTNFDQIENEKMNEKHNRANATKELPTLHKIVLPIEDEDSTSTSITCDEPSNIINDANGNNVIILTSTDLSCNFEEVLLHNSDLSRDCDSLELGCINPSPIISSMPPTSKKFDYESHRKGHFENYLKDLAARLGHSGASGENFIREKRKEIINKGII
jgi:hypothetical protein